MTELFSNIGSIIIMYFPTIMSVVTVLVNIFTTLKKLKSIDVKKEVETAVAPLKKTLDETVANNRQLLLENGKLRQKLDELITQYSKVEVRYDKSKNKDV